MFKREYLVVIEGTFISFYLFIEVNGLFNITTYAKESMATS